MSALVPIGSNLRREARLKPLFDPRLVACHFARCSVAPARHDLLAPAASACCELKLKQWAGNIFLVLTKWLRSKGAGDVLSCCIQFGDGLV